MVAFTSYLMLAFMPIAQIGMILTMMSQASASGARGSLKSWTLRTR